MTEFRSGYYVNPVEFKQGRHTAAKAKIYAVRNGQWSMWRCGYDRRLTFGASYEKANIDWLSGLVPLYPETLIPEDGVPRKEGIYTVSLYVSDKRFDSYRGTLPVWILRDGKWTTWRSIQDRPGDVDLGVMNNVVEVGEGLVRLGPLMGSRTLDVNEWGLEKTDETDV